MGLLSIVLCGLIGKPPEFFSCTNLANRMRSKLSIRVGGKNSVSQFSGKRGSARA